MLNALIYLRRKNLTYTLQLNEGALLENVSFFKGTNEVNFKDTSITENTRVSYPIEHINNIAIPSYW